MFFSFNAFFVCGKKLLNVKLYPAMLGPKITENFIWPKNILIAQSQTSSQCLSEKSKSMIIIIKYNILYLLPSTDDVRLSNIGTNEEPEVFAGESPLAQFTSGRNNINSTDLRRVENHR